MPYVVVSSLEELNPGGLIQLTTITLFANRCTLRTQAFSVSPTRTLKLDVLLRQSVSTFCSWQDGAQPLQVLQVDEVAKADGICPSKLYAQRIR
ncbi:uncharacterized protein LOC9631588 isoform X3 [Selaginella moellendorffii]|uniref:uncharacterized protein LOC9631588 isoform X3 n=1 Tax=Selaginella moellendorffii TaxID=88036 RepID=UPI000D1C41BD|nr:uncharacterized protein LOC9631588 isoform X3 [Selaginella moellendorffii]|eukprot:XP_024529065.1 uncharacterized protein LOC9631588 isoform X3 [Selaginella moellendorffii]